MLYFIQDCSKEFLMEENHFQWTTLIQWGFFFELGNCGGFSPPLSSWLRLFSLFAFTQPHFPLSHTDALTPTGDPYWWWEEEVGGGREAPHSTTYFRLPRHQDLRQQIVACLLAAVSSLLPHFYTISAFKRTHRTSRSPFSSAHILLATFTRQKGNRRWLVSCRHIFPSILDTRPELEAREVLQWAGTMWRTRSTRHLHWTNHFHWYHGSFFLHNPPKKDLWFVQLGL